MSTPNDRGSLPNTANSSPPILVAYRRTTFPHTQRTGPNYGHPAPPYANPKTRGFPAPRGGEDIHDHDPRLGTTPTPVPKTSPNLVAQEAKFVRAPIPPVYGKQRPFTVPTSSGVKSRGEVNCTSLSNGDKTIDMLYCNKYIVDDASSDGTDSSSDEEEPVFDSKQDFCNGPSGIGRGAGFLDKRVAMFAERKEKRRARRAARREKSEKERPQRCEVRVEEV
ncbi:hypothetical protein NLI96_g7918 [Meripilus lineatus]|uniref:Uncharacterized protein n=1 Tax=Meripilus lineatus TaxID=2056292 RepID=A0AAD5V0G8_9APHY|nr:hypothetical protein NLI96_g7918 [Physisporinus lineatus]